VSDRKTILLVEDNAIIRLNETEMLRNEGYAVIGASSGETAVETARAIPSIDLILMDINLGKGMDGTEAARLILKDYDIPIVFLSGYTDREIVERTEKITSYGYVVKDSGVTVLDASIKMAFKLHKAHRALVEKETALQKSEELFRSLVETTSDWIWEIDKNGVYTYASPQVEQLMGYRPDEMIGRTPFDLMAAPEGEKAATVFHETAPALGRFSGLVNTCTRKDGTLAVIETNGTPVFDAEGRYTGYRGFDRDITRRRQAEEEVATTVKFLRVMNEKTSTVDLIGSALATFQTLSGCEAVGIRLKEGDDYPYFETRGFAQDFVVAERSLCSRDDAGCVVHDSAGNPVLECMCGNILSGRTNPSKPFFSAHGSFWSNCTTELLATTTEEDRQARTRNRCNGEGYESVALVPIRVGNETLGLVQLNDRQKGRFSLESISLWERLADQLALGLSRSLTEERLRSNLDRLHLAQEAARAGSWEWDLLTGTNIWSDELWNVYGMEPHSRAPSYSAWLESVHPEDRERAARVVQEATEHEVAFNAEWRANDPTAAERWLLSRGVPMRDDAGHVVRYIGIVMDITDHKRAEEALRKSEDRFRSYFELGLIGMAITSPTKGMIEVNEKLCEILGYERDELLQKTWAEMTHPDDLAADTVDFNRVITGATDGYSMDKRWVRKDGSVVFSTISVKCARRLDGSVDYFVALVQDITDRKRAEAQLQASLKEKEILLREIHHRVKNNLAVIASLLSLQAGSTDDEKARDILLECQKRAQTMALIHTHLYQSRNLAQIDFIDYVNTLVNTVSRSYQVKAGSVIVTVTGRGGTLDVDHAVPLGLIVNELLSNSIKHAFPAGMEGSINIDLSQTDGRMVLSFADDGIGLPPEFDLKNAETLGMQLVVMLAEQLEGTVELDGKGGTMLRIGFNTDATSSGTV
jgi:PAS domain S-box-containing protein